MPHFFTGSSTHVPQMMWPLAQQQMGDVGSFPQILQLSKSPTSRRISGVGGGVGGDTIFPVNIYKFLDKNTISTRKIEVRVAFFLPTCSSSLFILDFFDIDGVAISFFVGAVPVVSPDLLIGILPLVIVTSSSCLDFSEESAGLVPNNRRFMPASRRLERSPWRSGKKTD